MDGACQGSKQKNIDYAGTRSLRLIDCPGCDHQLR